ncbi:MAG: ATP-binding cassette domain-containing protein [Holosporales bacterium]|jgi:ATP-binding cassette subfamily F protein 3|nr:ATP-binding cassette domain-containing protein [Holosporales bacterium]
MIIIQNLVKNFGDRVIIRNFSYHFSKNTKIGIIGPNGIGKTTFLNIIIGLEEPDFGDIIFPKDCVLGYLPQSPCENPENAILDECITGHKALVCLQEKLKNALKKMEENYSDEVYFEYEKIEKEFADKDGYALSSKAKSILVGLGFETSQFADDPLILSGGWRMRLELAKLLINDPNFLILDEPTNHLDLPSLTWLEQYLNSFKGTLLFVSHDKEFLNNISTQIMHICNGNVNVYNGNFDSFIQQRESKEELVQKQKEYITAKQDQLQKFVDRFRSKASKAKQAQSKIKIIERLKQIEARLETEEPEKKATFKISMEKQSGKIVLDLKNCSIGYGNLALNKSLNLRIIRGDKIAIIGANGIGKSTLLKTIISEIPLIRGDMKIGNNVSIGYYSQSQLNILDPKLDALENVLSLTRGKVTYQQARSVLGCLLITKDDVKKQVGVLSGGEKSKVAIASLLAQRHNFLILDEPTNHLDMSSVEALSAALFDYYGSVLTVSHNRAFISSFATHVFKMEKDKKAELIGVE